MPGGEFDAISEILRIAEVTETDEGENTVNLSNLGLTVQRSYEDPPTYICRYGDHQRSTPAVMLGVTMKTGSNIIDICQRSKRRIRQLIEQEQRLPADIAVSAVSDQSENVVEKINDVVVNMLEAIVIVVIVVFLVGGISNVLRDGCEYPNRRDHHIGRYYAIRCRTGANLARGSDHFFRIAC